MIKSINAEFKDPDVKKRFNKYEKNVRVKLLFLRQLIFETAGEIKEIGKLEESLKWGEPSYVSSKPKVGSPIRINRIKNTDRYAIYFNCKSNLVSTFKQIFPKTFTYGGDRSIIFRLDDKIPINELRHCISMALTYHINKKSMNPTNSK